MRVQRHLHLNSFPNGNGLAYLDTQGLVAAREQRALMVTATFVQSPLGLGAKKINGDSFE
jgi:hypothetical protein